MSKPALKIGLEIHTQLHTVAKLFSQSTNATSNLALTPNTTTSFFDVSLPGTQPKLNHQILLNALKLAISLNCKISPVSSFDRKHYFYGDQPLGYQITQHFNPIAQNGHLMLWKRHNPKLSQDVKIAIQQLQIEQDTGRSIYHSINSSDSNIDFNRSNIPLIEMVTLPDFSSIDQVRAFVQNYIKLVQDLDISTGDLESGSIRVDVNINLVGHQRVEIKNLPTISAILNAIRYEEKRQLQNLQNNNLPSEIETRGWDGKKTYHLRSKDSNIDYRYTPDMELPKIKLNLSDLLTKIKSNLPMSVDDKLDLYLTKYNLNLRDAKILVNNKLIESYFLKCWNLSNEQLQVQSKIINWLVNDLLGFLNKSEIQFDENILIPECFLDLIKSVEDGLISKPNGKLLLLHLVNNKPDQVKSMKNLASEFDMIISENETDNNQIDELITNVINSNEKVVNEIKKGKVKKINFLIGLLMKETRGNIQPKIFEDKIKRYLNL